MQTQQISDQRIQDNVKPKNLMQINLIKEHPVTRQTEPISKHGIQAKPTW